MDYIFNCHENDRLGELFKLLLCLIKNIHKGFFVTHSKSRVIVMASFNIPWSSWGVYAVSSKVFRERGDGWFCSFILHNYTVARPIPSRLSVDGKVAITFNATHEHFASVDLLTMRLWLIRPRLGPFVGNSSSPKEPGL